MPSCSITVLFILRMKETHTQNTLFEFNDDREREESVLDFVENTEKHTSFFFLQMHRVVLFVEKKKNLPGMVWRLPDVDLDFDFDLI